LSDYPLSSLFERLLALSQFERLLKTIRVFEQSLK